eukprot:TRINITY_DN989_c0_g1_i2.p1 TRINITY_DN989_c0_g1~~TRINITY_DN989_c0_g1_i2.p1  ORF type:complete len:111 (-),score=30.88 TRINITY_DN989_c0_g1_i2:94-426(-)
MARRNTSNILALAFAACAIYLLIPTETFIAPQALRGSSIPADGNSLAQGVMAEARAPGVSMAASDDPSPTGMTDPRKINLLYIALLLGTAVIGLLGTFFYGSYSGAGSGL